MKWNFLFFALAILVVSACTDDESPQPADNLLSYDGPNQSGPVLATGDYEAAARFTSAETSRFQGRQLVEVTWFTGPLPENAEVRIYGPGTGNQPGMLLYGVDVTDELREFSWNRHALTSPVAIEGDELWISIAFSHVETQQSIGCDAGPNTPDGDWFYRSSPNTWERYSSFTPERINWNIRGVVD